MLHLTYKEMGDLATAIIFPTIERGPLEMPLKSWKNTRSAAQKIADAKPSLTEDISMFFKTRWGVDISPGLPPHHVYQVDLNEDEIEAAIIMADGFGESIRKQWMPTEAREAFRRQWGRLLKKLLRASSSFPHAVALQIKEVYGIENL